MTISGLDGYLTGLGWVGLGWVGLGLGWGWAGSLPALMRITYLYCCLLML